VKEVRRVRLKEISSSATIWKIVLNTYISTGVNVRTAMANFTSFHLKNGIFLRNQCYDNFFCEINCFCVKKPNIYQFFQRKYFKNHWSLEPIREGWGQLKKNVACLFTYFTVANFYNTAPFTVSCSTWRWTWRPGCSEEGSSQSQLEGRKTPESSATEDRTPHQYTFWWPKHPNLCSRGQHFPAYICNFRKKICPIFFWEAASTQTHFEQQNCFSFFKKRVGPRWLGAKLGSFGFRLFPITLPLSHNGSLKP
jgi:hypothetical protein